MRHMAVVVVSNPANIIVLNERVSMPASHMHDFVLTSFVLVAPHP